MTTAPKPPLFNKRDIDDALGDAAENVQPPPQEEKALAPRERAPEPSAIALNGQRLAVADHGEMMRMARAMFSSNVKVSGASCVEDVFMALLTVYERGLPLSAVASSVYIVNGKPTLYGDAVMALTLKTGELAEFIEEEFGDWSKPADDAGWKVTIARKTASGAFLRTSERFTFGEGKTAGLTGKGPWKNYPSRMCKWRARAWAIRALFADVLGGLSLAEEFDEEGFDPSRMRVASGGSSDALREIAETVPED